MLGALVAGCVPMSIPVRPEVTGHVANSSTGAPLEAARIKLFTGELAVHVREQGRPISGSHALEFEAGTLAMQLTRAAETPTDAAGAFRFDAVTRTIWYSLLADGTLDFDNSVGVEVEAPGYCPTALYREEISASEVRFDIKLAPRDQPAPCGRAAPR
jgi:hypothetical protein